MACSTGCPTQDHASFGECRKYHCQRRGHGPRVCGSCATPYVSCDSTRDGYCPPCASEYSREYRRRTNADGLWQKRRRLRDKGITQEQHDAMLLAQGGVCAICNTTDPGAQVTWHIDHDHACCPGQIACGKCFRGLLCAKCNKGLGIFKDDPALLHRAAAYLEGANARQELL